jgi:hypothetical protein
MEIKPPVLFPFVTHPTGAEAHGQRGAGQTLAHNDIVYVLFYGFLEKLKNSTIHTMDRGVVLGNWLISLLGQPRAIRYTPRAHTHAQPLGFVQFSDPLTAINISNNLRLSSQAEGWQGGAVGAFVRGLRAVGGLPVPPCYFLGVFFGVEKIGDVGRPVLLVNIINDLNACPRSALVQNIA